MKQVLRVLPVAVALLTAAFSVPGWGQTATEADKSSKAEAYYHAALAHLYTELAASFGGRGEYVSKAVENYKRPWPQIRNPLIWRMSWPIFTSKLDNFVLRSMSLNSV